MPQLPNKELEVRVKAAGKSLLHPPSSVDELLPLLDRTEVLLAKVDQSPAKSMFTVLSPLMNALVSEKLLKHSDVDVKVGVASCISEITRITAPEAPYDDDKMKDVFQLIVSSFRDISDTSSRSHRKRAIILETVAKVRSCVVMLDLECDQMIIEMFQHFLNAIREDHAELIFSSMEAIMTLVLEESEDISPDLLNPILSTLKKNNETVLPIAKKLAERVVRCCADKIRPYLPQALKTIDACLEDYSEVVASVCCENNGSAAHSDENILTAQSVIESKSTSSPVGASLPQVVKESIEETDPQDQDLETQISPKSTVANGVDEAGTDETMANENFSKKASDDSGNASDANLVSKAESGDLGAEEPAKMEAKVDQVAKTKGKQFNSENDSAESSDAHDSSKKQSEQVPCNQENADEGIHNSPSEVPPVEEDVSLVNVKDSSIQLSPSEATENEGVNEATPMQSDSLPEKNQLKKSARTKRNGNSVKKGTVSVGTTSKKGENVSGAKKPDKKKPAIKTKDSSLIEEDESKNDGESETEMQKVSDEENIFSGAMKKRRSGKPAEKCKKESSSIEENEVKNDGGNGSGSEIKSLDQTENVKVSNEENISGAKKPQKSNSGAKKQRRSGKKQPAKKAKKESPLIEEVESKNDVGSGSDSETKSLNLSEKLRDAIKRKDGESSSRKEDGKKSGVKPRPEKDVSEASAREDDVEDMVTSPRSPLKSTKDGGSKEETLRMSTKRKRTPGTEKASGASEIGENLVGSKVKVWWPKDKAFYEGVVHSFDSARKKHKIVYVDGDEEVLNLKKEKWEFVADEPVADEAKAAEHSSNDASSDAKKKKTGTSSESSSKHAKMETSDKRKSKDTATKSKGKSKDDDKIEPKTKSNSKSSGKSEDETIKSKDRSQKLSDAKASGKSKDLDVAAKSNKGKTPQSGKTLASATTKSSSSKVKETDKMKDSAKSSSKLKETDKVVEDTAKSSSKAKETDKAKDKQMDSANSREIGKRKSQDGDAKSAKKQKR